MSESAVFKYSIVAALAACMIVCSGFQKPEASSSSNELPNIVFIMSDDLGWGEVGVYPCTSSVGRISTPNLDRFASDGMMFTNAYAGYTVCAPSRTTLFTGRHSGQFPRYNLPGTSLAPGAAVTTAEVLKKAGYRTAAVGKCAPLDNPVEQGFDYFLGQIDQAACHQMYPDTLDFMNETGSVNLTLNYKPKSRELCMANPDQYNYTVDYFQNTAQEWVRNNGNRGPFFLYLAFTVPHAGGWGPGDQESGAPVPTDGQYANRTWPDVEKDHASVITYLDGYVGDLMGQLDSMGLADNTMVIFASDNGAHLEGGHDVHFFNSTGGLKGHKRSMFEGGMRSPTMVKWPGKVAAGSTSSYPWSFWDVMPTLADIAGVSSAVPNDIDGHSILPTLLGKQQDEPEYVFFTGASSWGDKNQKIPPPIHSAAAKTSAYAVRSGQWKGVVQSCTTTPSVSDVMFIYNLTADPFETNDLGNTAIGKQKIAMLKNIVLSKNLTCTCFQC